MSHGRTIFSANSSYNRSSRPTVRPCVTFQVLRAAPAVLRPRALTIARNRDSPSKVRIQSTQAIPRMSGSQDPRRHRARR